MSEAYLSEVFLSIQGEGPDVGRSAVFVRFGGCNLKCSYCDTEYAWERAPDFPVCTGEGSETLRNPAETADVAGLLGAGARLPGLAVLTGGEPLLQPGAVADIARHLHSMGCRVHLETNGTLPDELGAVERHLDSVSIDIKLPSLVGGKDYTRRHVESIRLMRGLEGSVKIIVTDAVPESEVEAAIRLIAGVNQHVPVFLQPAMVDSRFQIGASNLLGLQARAARKLSDVRISIQIHKLLGVR
jgi:organic radical activating enzyme